MDIIHDNERPAEVEITTFGYLHGDAPEGAHITLDLRTHFRDPHVTPALRNLTARDAEVRTAALTTPGIPFHVDLTAAAVVGSQLGKCLTNLWGVPATVTHRDLDKEVISR